MQIDDDCARLYRRISKSSCLVINFVRFVLKFYFGVAPVSQRIVSPVSRPGSSDGSTTVSATSSPGIDQQEQEELNALYQVWEQKPSHQFKHGTNFNESVFFVIDPQQNQIQHNVAQPLQQQQQQSQQAQQQSSQHLLAQAAHSVNMVSKR